MTTQDIRTRMVESEDILRDILGIANEAPQYGPFDQIDNDGDYYQSEAFQRALNRGRKYLARVAVLSPSSLGDDT